MTEEKVWELLVLKLSGEATPEQLAELDIALQQYPEYSFQLGAIENAWKSKQQREPLHTADSYNRHLQRLSNHLSDETLKYESGETASEPLPVPTTKRLYRRIVMITAVAAALLLAFILVYNNKESEKPKPVVAAVQNLVSTKNGSKTKIQLPDGTQVWLNSGSKISYDNDFTGATRQVNLKGEAFFDVVKDASRPFIIHTDAVDIKVLGTAFNVRSYPDDKVTETALIRGSVEITLHTNPDKKIVLRPSEKLIVKNDTSALVSNKTTESDRRQTPILALTQVHYVDHARDSSSMETLWTKNKLVFDGETLQQVAQKLERWYGVQVIIQSDKLKSTEYNGIFEDENISEVLYALQLTGNFNYTIKKKEVIIRP